MKHALPGLIGFLAFTVVSQPLFAAEVDIPAGQAAERAAPKERRVRPAQQAARQTSQTSQSTLQSWTGSQVGGFGGGNISGGTFTDPGADLCFRNHGVQLSPIGLTCPETPFDFRNSHGGGTGGGYYSYTIPFGGVIVGFEADVAYKNLSTSANLAVAPVVNGPFGVGCPGCFSTRTENFTGSISQGWDTSFRARLGYLVTPITMVYFTTGVAVERISGTFSYNATVVNNITPAGGGVYVDTVSGAASWSQTKTGWTVGGGFETLVARGLKARIEYRYTGFGDLSQDVALTRACIVTTAPGCFSPNTGSTNAHIDLGNVNFHTIRAGLAVGL
jgi:opacity protein-like surface antigen